MKGFTLIELIIVIAVVAVIANAAGMSLYQILHGTEYSNDPDVIYSVFSDTIDMMIDDGKLPESLPSTVVDVSGNEGITVIREGAVSANKIKEAIG